VLVLSFLLDNGWSGMTARWRLVVPIGFSHWLPDGFGAGAGAKHLIQGDSRFDR
tara:strand:- start:1712 stop:1873 length:162 start_codon:yes stop_codon:yes gene_type:complete